MGPSGIVDVTGAWAAAAMKEDGLMSDSSGLTSSRARGVTIVVLLPLLWWCVTLTAGALGVWRERIGDVVATWNIDTAVGLILLIPAAYFALSGQSQLRSSDTFRRGRRHATAGLSLTVAFCLLHVSNPVLDAALGPVRQDPTSWSPVLTTGEQWVVAVPSAMMLIPAALALITLWRRDPPRVSDPYPSTATPPRGP